MEEIENYLVYITRPSVQYRTKSGRYGFYLKVQNDYSTWYFRKLTDSESIRYKDLSVRMTKKHFAALLNAELRHRPNYKYYLDKIKNK